METKTKFFDVFCKISKEDYADFFKEYEVNYGEDCKSCVSCGEPTHFTESDFSFHVCSIECLETLDKYIYKFLEDTLGK